MADKIEKAESDLKEVIKHYMSTPIHLLGYETYNPAIGLERAVKAGEYDSTSDSYFNWMRSSVAHLSDTIWRMQSVVHPDTLIGRLIIESGRDPSIATSFRRFKRLMVKDHMPGLG